MYNLKSIIIILLMILPISSYAKPLQITTSTSHIASIVRMITQAETEINVITSDTSCPHHYHLKPSDIAQIKSADLVIYINDKFEVFMQPLLKSTKAKKIAIKNIPDITIIDNNWHIWLDLKNVKIILKELHNMLVTLAPEQKEIWGNNLSLALQKIQELENYKNKSFSDLSTVLSLSDSTEYLFAGTNVKVEKSYIHNGIMSVKKISNLSKKTTGYCIVMSNIDNYKTWADKLKLPIIPLKTEEWVTDGDVDDYASHYRSLIGTIESNCRNQN